MPFRRTAQQIRKLNDAAVDAAQQDIPAQNMRNQLPSRTLPPATSSNKGAVSLSDATPQPLGTAGAAGPSAASTSASIGFCQMVEATAEWSGVFLIIDG